MAWSKSTGQPFHNAILWHDVRTAAYDVRIRVFDVRTAVQVYDVRIAVYSVHTVALRVHCHCKAPYVHDRLNFGVHKFLLSL